LTRPLLTFLFVLFFLPADALSKTPLFRMNSGASEPLSNDEQTGFYNRIATEIFRRLDIPLKYVRLPSERSLIHGNQGIDDGVIARIEGLDKKWRNLVRVPEEIISWEFSAFSYDVDIEVKGWESLKPYSVGIIRGWHIYEENLADANALTKVSTPKQLFRLLSSGRIDIAMFERLRAQYWMKKLDINPPILAPEIAKKALYIYVHKKHAALVPKLTRVIAAIKKDGTYERIFNATLAIE